MIISLFCRHIHIQIGIFFYFCFTFKQFFFLLFCDDFERLHSSQMINLFQHFQRSICVTYCCIPSYYSNIRWMETSLCVQTPHFIRKQNPKKKKKKKHIKTIDWEFDLQLIIFFANSHRVFCHTHTRMHASIDRWA